MKGMGLTIILGGGVLLALIIAAISSYLERAGSKER